MSLTCKVPQLRFGEFSGEWEERQLGTLCKLKAGKFVSASEISEKQEDEMFPCYGGNGLRGYVRTQTHEGNYALIGRQGALCGNVQFTSGKFHATEHAVVVSQNEENDSLWLYYQLDRLNLNRYATGQAQPGLSVDVIEKVKTSIPSKPEQQKIASFLSAVDTKIGQLTRKKELLEQYKKGVMQKIFSQELRFKDDDGSEFSEWVEKKLGEVLKIGSGRDYKHLGNGNIPVFGTGGYMLSVNDYLYDGETVCIGRKGTIDKPMFFSGKIWTVDTLFYTHSFKNSVPKYIYFVFQFINWKKYNEASGVPSLSKSTIESIELNLPSLKEQIKIANFLSSLDSKLLHVSQQLEATKQFKKALLQQMFV